MRMIRAQLVTRVRDESVVLGWLEYVQQRRKAEARDREERWEQSRRVRWNMRRWIWGMWLHRESRRQMIEQKKKKLQRREALYRWVHVEREITGRIIHAMQCVMQYHRWVQQPRRQALEREAKRAARRAWCRWFVCGTIVRRHKEMKQEKTLEARAAQRRGLICSRTRNVGRLGPKGGVVYDETDRRGSRLKETEICKACTVQRWPHRDKCGPTLAQILHRVWEVT